MSLTDAERAELEALKRRIPEKFYKMVDSNPLGDIHRYSIHIRIQHALTFITFFFLIVTGLPIHFNDAFWAKPLNEAFGGIYYTRILHRTNAALMVFSMLYHVLTLVFGTMKKMREHQIEEHYLEYMRTLEENPVEREYVKNLLDKAEGKSK